MDRFSWADGLLAPDEQLICQQEGVRLYDGDAKTSFDYGRMVLTTHRIIWRDHKDQSCVISLHLSYVVYIEEAAAGFYKSPKIVMHLNSVTGYRPPGPVTSSPNSYVKLSFKEGGETEFHRCLTESLARKLWEYAAAAAPQTVKGKQVRSGIGGIEKKLQEKSKLVDQNISVAFADLGQLMEKAKDMVRLSKDITNKIRDKQGEITEDETVRFKSYLLSLGIADPVTRETHGTGDKYFKELAKQISSSMEGPLKDCGGIMTLTDVYCRMNRARGMELLSPEDLVNACKQLDSLKMPVRLRVFESGVMVLQLHSHREEEVIIDTTDSVSDKGSLTADELAKLIGMSVVLCKERLLLAEKSGKLCRDETVEGLKFYPNLFLSGS